MSKKIEKRFYILLFPVLAALALCFLTSASRAADNTEARALAFPQITETDCTWDDNGNLILETAHDLSGQPALNARGFYRAEYTWDDDNNLLSEAYYGLNGEPVVSDRGYARAEYTYHLDEEGHPHISTENRWDADGNRADIPGSYSYRRDEWDGGRILSSEYFAADGSPVRPTGGFAKILYEYTNHETTYTQVKRYLDADGSPMTGTEGGARVISEFTKAEYFLRDPRTEELALDMMIPEAEQQEAAPADTGDPECRGRQSARRRALPETGKYL